MQTYFNRNLSMTGLLLVLAIVVAAAGCKTPMKGPKIEPSGFLGDYSQLQPGKSGQAQLVYLNPKADFAKYTKIMIDPVTIWAGKDSKLGELPEKDAQALLGYLDGKLKEELSKDYAIADKPGPDVMRLRVALTEAKGTQVVRNTLSSVVPIGMAISVLKLAATGTHTAVGEANIEGELVDSQTSERLSAAVDSRAGRKAIVSGNFTKWGDVQDAFDYWTQQLRVRLETLREKKADS